MSMVTSVSVINLDLILKLACLPSHMRQNCNLYVLILKLFQDSL